MIEKNLQKIFAEIENGNNFGEKITLVGATKTQMPSTINTAIKFGLLNVGENKAQEFRDKIDQIDKSAIHHFFGRLQSNKVKYLVGKVSLLQSVDSLPLAKVISEKSLKLGIVTNILLEVNFSNDQNKGGFSEIELSDNIDKITKLDGICVKGLMSVLPKMDTEDKLAQSFDEIRKVYDYYKSLYPDFSILSMGMSSDYKIAIKHGSNMIRIGTDIFGPRDYGDK